MRKLIAVLVLVSGTIVGCSQNSDRTAEPQLTENAALAADAASIPHVVAGSDIEAGRYLVIVGGCNDCHTHGYLQTEGDVPESEWLLGSPFGWRGPWGTTYPANLRLTVDRLSEDGFVTMLHTRKVLPPMPWMNVAQMSEQDIRAMYRYIRTLGPRGEDMPAPVPPDQEPQTPYLDLMPKNL